MNDMSSRLEELPQLLLGVGEAKIKDGVLSFSRLSPGAAAQVADDEMLTFVAANGSGVRLAFKTEATHISLELELTRIEIGNMPVQEVAVITVVDGVEAELPVEVITNRINPVFPERNIFNQGVERIELSFESSSEPRDIEIWLPHNCKVEISRLDSNATLEPKNPSGPKWVHYGSSISHSGEATNPLDVWPVRAARQLGLEIVNLGLAGQAQLDQFAARTIVAHKPDYISLKLGINVVNANSLNARTFPYAVHGFLDTIRDSLPEVPILVSTAIFCPPHEQGVGPTIFNIAEKKAEASPTPNEMVPMTLNLAMTRNLIEKVFETRSKTDKNLYLISGLELFDETDSRDLPDDLHPNHEGYKRMADRFAKNSTVRSWLSNY